MTTYSPRQAATRAPEDAHRPALPSQQQEGALFQQQEQKATAPVPKGSITLSTTVQYRGRLITITATDMNADQFCDLLEKRGFDAPAPRQWQTLPDGTPLCPKHNTPMKLRNKQGDEWYSHRVFGPDGEELWCKGYHGKDSPGYEY